MSQPLLFILESVTNTASSLERISSFITPYVCHQQCTPESTTTTGSTTIKVHKVPSNRIGDSLSPPPLTREIVIKPHPLARVTSTPFKTSNYPRTSPFSPLHFESNIPQHINEAMQQPLQPKGSAGALEGVGTQTWFAVLVVLTVAVAGLWSAVVAAIHWRGVTTGAEPQRLERSKAAMRRVRDERDEGEEGEEEEEEAEVEAEAGKPGRWKTWLHALNPVQRSKYKLLPAKPSEAELDDYTIARPLSSAHDLPSRLCDISSPENPFLIPPTAQCRTSRPRNSTEWAEQHRAFFAALAFAPGSPVNKLSGAEMARVEMEAREAQDGRAAVAGALGDVVRGRGERNWVDLGLAVVDEVVDSVVTRIVRWTDDRGRHEELVLPLAKGTTK